jgi:integrase
LEQEACTIRGYGVSEVEMTLRQTGKGYVFGINATQPFNSWVGQPEIAGTAEQVARGVEPSSWRFLAVGDGTKDRGRIPPCHKRERFLQDCIRCRGTARVREIHPLSALVPLPPAAAPALAYRAGMAARGLSAAAVNRRLAALRSLVKLANRLGMVPWKLDVKGAKPVAYRDTRGPGRDAYRTLLAVARAQPGAKGLRDAAIVRLLHDVALRRSELVRLDLEDVDLAAACVMVLGKGRAGKEPVALPASTAAAALAGWIAARGAAGGPLFGNFDRSARGRAG